MMDLARATNGINDKAPVNDIETLRNDIDQGEKTRI